MSAVLNIGRQDYERKVIYKDFKLSPLPIQIDDSYNLYFQNKEKKLFKFNIESISKGIIELERILGEVQINSPKDNWQGDSIVFTDNELISKTGEYRKSIPYGIEIMLHCKCTPIIDRYGYIRDLHSDQSKDIETLTWIRQCISDKILNVKIRKSNLNHFNNELFKSINNQHLEVVEINSEDESVWAEFERLRDHQKKQLEKTEPENTDVWSHTSNVDKYDIKKV